MAKSHMDVAVMGSTLWSRRIIVIWLLGTLVALPVQFIRLPLNMDLVDIWILVGLLVFWLSFAFGRQTIRENLSYAVAMWFILISSLLSALAAPNVTNSLTVILKEVYLFVWLATLTYLLSRLRPRDFRLVMSVWLGTAALHGSLIIAQFISPDLWRLITGLMGRPTEAQFFRPAGLFLNANAAAFFQLVGFVPFVLARPSKGIATVLGIVLTSGMLATGSMGITIAFIAGLLIAALAIAALGHGALVTHLFGRLVITVSILAGLLFLFISEDHGYQNHLERILLERGERSSEGRFALWQRGLDVLLERDVFLGIGPENFREVDEHGKQLHNDLLAFVVERGLLGVSGLVLFGGIAVGRALTLLRINRSYAQRATLPLVVFPAAIVAMLLASLTHQVFHYREMWLVLAIQETMLLTGIHVKRDDLVSVVYSRS